MSSKARTVLVYGETGTGKGLVARMLHECSAPAPEEAAAAKPSPLASVPAAGVGAEADGAPVQAADAGEGGEPPRPPAPAGGPRPALKRVK